MSFPSPPDELPAVPTDDAADKTEHLKQRYATELEQATAVWYAQIEDAKDSLKHDRAIKEEQRQRLETRRDVDRQAEVESVAAVEAAYIEVAKGSLDRSLRRAELHTGLIAAVGTIYSTILGLRFGVGADAEALPGRAIWPAVFLGVALVLAANYVAGIRRKVIVSNILPTGSPGMVAEERLRSFFTWTFAGVLARGWAIRSSVVAFGLSIVLLPVGFLDLTEGELAVLIGGSTFVLVFYAAIDGISAFLNKDKSPYDTPVPPAVR